jgi:4-hydroxy-3-polyprenylbenzoate decarboxylase
MSGCSARSSTRPVIPSSRCAGLRAWSTENMLKLTRMGASMVPPMPAFYNHPQTVDDIVNHIVARVLDQFDIAAPFAKRWDGHMHTATKIATVANPTAKSGT